MSRDFIYKENDNIYLNTIFNTPEVVYYQSTTAAPTGEAPIPMEYTVDKTLAILDKSSDYYASVIRFDIPLNQIPLFIMPIIPADQQPVTMPPTPANPNLTPMIIGIQYGTSYFPINLIYYPYNNQVPPVQTGNTQIITPYYYVYTPEVLINMINIALLQAYNAAGLNTLFAGVTPPFFYYDGVIQLINLVVPSFFTTLTSPATSIPYIFINESTFRYLDSYTYYFYGYNQVNGVDYIFTLTNVTPNNPSNSTPPQIYPSPNQAYALPGTSITSPPSYYIYRESYSTIQLWSSLRKLIMTTGSIPINSESVPGKFNGSVNVSLPVLTDFVVPLEYIGNARSVAYYVPTGQYRLIDMTSDTPLQKISIRVYWEDTNGNMYPVYISINQRSSIKIGFFRKSLYKGSKLLLK